MQCSKCGSRMQKGRLEVHGSVTGAMMIGFSLEDLYWYDQDRASASRRRVLNSGDARSAYACKPCGLITFDTTQPSGSQQRRARRKARRNRLLGRS